MFRFNQNSHITSIVWFLTFTVLAFSFVGTVDAQTDIYVDAVNGDNRTGEGSAEKPYKTITFALAISAKNNIPDPWHVHIRPGTYDADPAKPPINREVFPLKLRDGMILEGTASAVECIIDAQHLSSSSIPIIDGTSVSNSVIRNLTIQNMNRTSGNGGGIELKSTTGTIDGCVIDNNSGGGVWTDQSLTMTNNTFSNNSGKGGFFVEGNFIGNISQHTFSNNTGRGGFYVTGAFTGDVLQNTFSDNSGTGGFYVTGAFTGDVLQNMFSDNSNSNGGGFLVNRNFIGNVSGNTFTNNKTTGSSGSGGGFCISGNFTGDVSQNIFTSNSSVYGCGFYVGGSFTDNVSQNTFKDNSKYFRDGYGGGCYIGNFSGNVSRNTFSGNSASQGGGGCYLAGSSTGRVVNNLFIDNTASGLGSAVYTSAACTFENNLFTDNGAKVSTVWLSSDQCRFHNNIFSGMQTAIFESSKSEIPITHNIFHNIGIDIISRQGSGMGNDVLFLELLLNNANDNLSQDPLFVGNDDYHLQATSPAINAGINEFAPDVDFDGVGRPVGAAVDIGPYEFGGSPTKPTPANVALSVEPATLEADGTSKAVVTATVTASNGTTITGETVTFQIVGGSGQLSAVTDRKDGTYTATYTAGKTPSAVKIEAKTTNGKTGSVTLTLTAPKQEGLTHGMFNFSLLKGLNFISLPVRPATPFTAQRLIDHLGATMLTKFDAARQTFVPYLPGLSDDFSIEGGQGYIVNVTEAKTATFTGTVWDNVNDAPDLTPAPSPRWIGMQAPTRRGEFGTVWAFVIGGEFSSGDFSRSPNITVRNLRTGEMLRTAQNGGNRYAVAFADLSRRSVVEAGDVLEIGVDGVDGMGEHKVRPYTVTPEDLRRAFARIDIDPSALLPKQTILLQNYPNPFNPETWMPYQLIDATEVGITIYDIRGMVVRRLDLGHKPSGYYHNRGRAAYWDGRSTFGEFVASGIYFYQLIAGEFTSTRRMVIVK